MAKTKSIIVLLLILLTTTLFAGIGNSELKNSISFDYFYYKSYIKINPSYGSRNSIFMLDYYRTILDKNIFKLKFEAGLGIYKQSLGEADGLFPSLNTKLYVKGFVGKNRHQGFLGMGFDIAPYYLYIVFIIPIGYQFNITSRFFANVSFNQYMISINSRYNADSKMSIYTGKWIWNTDSNAFLLNIGVGFNF